MVDDAIRIDGLAAFSKRLKRLDSDLPKGLRLALNEAAELVIDTAVPRMPRRTGSAQKAVSARSTRTLSRVTLGSRRRGGVPWLDFGGEGRRRGRPPAREFIRKGRYLYPAYYEKRDSGEFERLLSRALLDVARGAGIEVDP